MATQRPVLRRGSGINNTAVRNDVRYLQTFLKEAGFLPSSATVDGAFGMTTESAVKVFQLSNQLTSDGVVGARTWEAIETYRRFFLAQHPNLRSGDGFSSASLRDDVQILQTLLIQAKFLPANTAIDGFFGLQTEKAVESFQKAQKLTADGIVGAKTWDALEAFVQNLKRQGNAASPSFVIKPPLPTPVPTAVPRPVPKPTSTPVPKPAPAPVPVPPVPRPVPKPTPTPVPKPAPVPVPPVPRPVPKPTPTPVPKPAPVPTATTYPVLRRGDGVISIDKRGAVKRLQVLLQKARYLSQATAIDGLFDADVESSVKAFQLDKGLVMDGVVGAVTWRELEALVRDLSPTPVPVPVPKPSPTPVPVPVPKPSPTPVPVPVPKPSPTPVPTPVPVPIPIPVPPPKEVTRPLLRYGDGINTPEKRPDVKQLQVLLQDARFLSTGEAVDGQFDRAVELAVKTLQTFVNLKVDGVVGSLTWQMLEQLAAEQRNREPMLQYRDGIDSPEYLDAVKHLQTLLVQSGFLPQGTVVDGLFGKQTETAVKALQSQYGLLPTGVVDESTWKAIRQAIAAAPTPTPTPVPVPTPSPVPTDNIDIISEINPNIPKPLLKRGAGINDPQLRTTVSYLQRLLKRGLFIPASTIIDGQFGRQTENGVKFFQVRQKLVSDGIVGTSTWLALESFIAQLEETAFQWSMAESPDQPVSLPSSPSSRSYPILQKGDGITAPNLKQDVKLLQLLLQRANVLSTNMPVDGLFGADTELALRQFQQLRNLIVDGVAGQQTWMSLFQQWVSAYFPPRPLIAYGDRLIASLPDSGMRRFASSSIPLILQECQRDGVVDLGQIAYVLATARHESRLGQWMLEFASGAAYEGRADLGNTQPGDGVRYKGRGFVQITGRLNYTRWSDRSGLDLLGNPAMTEEYGIAAIILVLGMRDGSFAGHKMDDHISGDRQDFVNARRIVNGLDKAELIAGYAKDFFKVMR